MIIFNIFVSMELWFIPKNYMNPSIFNLLCKISIFYRSVNKRFSCSKLTLVNNSQQDFTLMRACKSRVLYHSIIVRIN